MTVGVGTGATIAFTGTGSFSGQVLSFNIDGEEVPVIDVSHLGTTGYREKTFGVLIEPPQCTVELNFDPESPPPVGVDGTITVTFPDSSKLTGTGAFLSRSMAIPLEDKMTATYVFQFDGVTGPAFT